MGVCLLLVAPGGDMGRFDGLMLDKWSAELGRSKDRLGVSLSL